MYNIAKIKEDVFYIGASDRRLALFENMYPLANGVSYNAYLIKDEKTVLLDTVDAAVSGIFLENLAYALEDRSLDIIIVNHMEPDHCASLKLVLAKYPEAQLYGTMQVKNLISQFLHVDVSERFHAVKENDTLNTGKHQLTFVTAPMVHWPEVMVTYDAYDKILYAADAFGTFGALAGNLYADETDHWSQYLYEARRYYTNIVGRFGMNVQLLLKKAAGLELSMICPLHGPIIREDFDFYLKKYDQWSAYVPEDNAVTIMYGSIYGGTENACDILASLLAEKGVKGITLYDVSKTHYSYLVAEAFRCKALVFAAPTKDAGLFPPMAFLLSELKHKNLANRTVALIENGSWGPLAGKLMAEYFEGLKEIDLLSERVTLKSTANGENRDALKLLADKLAKSLA